MEELKCFTAIHSGGLKECLETEQPITVKTATKLIKAGIYKYYAYDDRIKADRFILVNMEKDLGLPTWVHIYDKK